jgi:hypothetical protein
MDERGYSNLGNGRDHFLKCVFTSMALCSSCVVADIYFTRLALSFHNHRCTRVENPGEGVRDVFAKMPRGGQGFQEKLPGGGPPILGFIAFLLTSFSKICLLHFIST